MNRTPIPRQSKKRLAEIAAGTYKPKAKNQFGAEGLRYSHGWQGIVGRYDELKRRVNGITL